MHDDPGVVVHVGFCLAIGQFRQQCLEGLVDRQQAVVDQREHDRGRGNG